MADSEVKLASYYGRYDRLVDDVRELKADHGQSLRNEIQMQLPRLLETTVKEKIEKLEKDYHNFKSHLEV